MNQFDLNGASINAPQKHWLDDPIAPPIIPPKLIYLVEMTAYHRGTASVQVLRYCSGSGYTNADGQFYEPRIEQPALLRRDIFSDGQIGGASQVGYGELTLVNADGALDTLSEYAVDGRELLIKVGDQSDDYANFITVLKATMQQVAFEWLRVSVRLRDRQAELMKPVQTLSYAGSNVLPAGLEGNSDLQDAKKPLLYGRCHNITPVLVNTSRLIYQITTGALGEVVNVFDKAAYLKRGADYSSQSDLETNAPLEGEFRIWKAGGVFRLGSSPAGLITCTAWESASIETCTAAQIAYRLATGPGGLSAADTVASDYTTLDGQNAGSIGLFVSPEMTVSEALDQVLASVGAWWGFDQLGRFRLARFDAPSGTPLTTLTDADILTIDQASLSVNSEASPVWKITLNHDINWSVQSSSSLAGVAQTERKNWLETASRQTTVSDASVKTAHLLAQDITYETLLVGAGYALPEAQRRLAMLKTDTTVLNASVRIDANLLAVLDLGAVNSIVLDWLQASCFASLAFKPTINTITSN